MASPEALLLNFRDALLGVARCFENIGLPWRRSGAYDGWDGCAAALFDALVVESLRTTMPSDAQDSVQFPDYDLLRPSYVGLHVIEVLPGRTNSSVRVFHAFGTTVAPFDVVEVRTVLRDGTPVSDVLDVVPITQATFAVLAMGAP